MMTNFHRVNSFSSDENFQLSCESIRSKLISPDQNRIESILVHDNPEQAEIVLPNGDKYVWYLAFGSMTNPISLYLRDLIPLISYPVKCLNHKLTFRTLAGMADIESSVDDEFHGVVHLLTNEQITRLDGIEVFYHRIQIDCFDYRNRSHRVYAYQTNINDQPTTNPHERYLDIIIKGCEYYKVQQEYIDCLRNTQQVIPRKSPKDFQSFDNIPLDVFYSIDELEKHNGTDPSLPLWICVNDKILEYAGLPSKDDPNYEFQRSFYSYFSQKLGGREITTLMARTLYEPLYKLPLNDDDICQEHRAQIEDDYYTTFACSQNKSYWTPIGRLFQKEK